MTPTIYTDDGVNLVASLPGVEVHIAAEEFVPPGYTNLYDLFPKVTINHRPVTWLQLTPDDLRALGCEECPECRGDRYIEVELPARSCVQLEPEHERHPCEECGAQGWVVRQCGAADCGLPMIGGDGTFCEVCCGLVGGGL